MVFFNAKNDHVKNDKQLILKFVQLNFYLIIKITEN